MKRPDIDDARSWACPDAFVVVAQDKDHGGVVASLKTASEDAAAHAVTQRRINREGRWIMILDPGGDLRRWADGDSRPFRWLKVNAKSRYADDGASFASTLKP